MIQPTPEQLRNVITEMDSLAQDAFTKIASMARLALLALEQHRAYAGSTVLKDITCMLNVIECKAGGAENDLNATAESVGCNYVDDAQYQYRRRAAQRKADEFAKSTGAAS